MNRRRMKLGDITVNRQRTDIIGSSNDISLIDGEGNSFSFIMRDAKQTSRKLLPFSGGLCTSIKDFHNNVKQYNKDKKNNYISSTDESDKLVISYNILHIIRELKRLHLKSLVEIHILKDYGTGIDFTSDAFTLDFHLLLRYNGDVDELNEISGYSNQYHGKPDVFSSIKSSSLSVLHATNNRDMNHLIEKIKCNDQVMIFK